MKLKNIHLQIGKSKGHFKFKHNRAQKIADQWDYLEDKMIGMIERGKCVTLTSRCAYAVLLMMETGIRIGNESSAEGYISINKYSSHFGKTVKTYGLTTLKKKHVKLKNGGLFLSFLGKKQVEQQLVTYHKTLINNYRTQLRAGLGGELLLNITKYELTKFVKKYVGRYYSPKDIRIAKVNRLFIDNISSDLRKANFTTKSDANKFGNTLLEKTAEQIGHTKTVCKSAYLSPQLFTFYKEHLYKILQENKDAGR